MAEQLVRRPALQLPQIAGPDAFGLVAVDQLPDDRRYSEAAAVELPASRQMPPLITFT